MFDILILVGHRVNNEKTNRKEQHMQKRIVVLTAVFVLTAAGLVLAQADDNVKEEQKGAGMMEGKDGMKGKGMMKMMGMMREMHNKVSVTATSDGGALVVSGGKLIKYDNQLNVVKEVDLPKSEMGMTGQDTSKAAAVPVAEVDHASHH